MSDYNVKGRRMVFEDDIKKIGEGGSGDYTAGTGIDITEGVISVDTETVAVKSDLATVATTGDYDDLTNKPTIPAAQVQSDWNQADSAEVDYIKNKPTLVVTEQGNNAIVNKSNLVVPNDVSPLYITGVRVFDFETSSSSGSANRNMVQGTGSFVFGRKNECYAEDTFEFGEGLSNFRADSANHNIYLGKYNDTTNNADNIITVGNGTANDARSNAMEVRKDGTIISKNIPQILSMSGTYTLQGTVDSQGDATYAWEPSSASVAIDNKTIIKNGNNELETAIGGWKETETVTSVTIPAGQNDWDLVDMDLAKTLYDYFQTNTRYDVGLTFLGVTNDFDTKTLDYAYIQSSSKTSTKFGGNGALNIKFLNETNTYSWEFYVEISTGKIHIYGGGGIRPAVANTGSITVDMSDFEPQVQKTTYHKIDPNYYDAKPTLGLGLKYDSNGYLNADINASTPIRKAQSGTAFLFGLDTYVGEMEIKKETPHATNRTHLGTVIGGGYSTRIEFYNTDITFDSTSNKWEVTSQRGQKIITDAFINYYRNAINDGATSVTTANLETFSVEVYNSNNQYITGGTSGVTASYSKNGTAVTVSTPSSNMFNVSFVFDSSDYSLTSVSYIMLNRSDQNADHFIYIPLRPIGAKSFGIIEQVDKKFIPLVSDIPAVDTTTDGTYVLEATVSSGAVTYAWVLKQ